MDIGAGDHTLTTEAIVADVVGRVVHAVATRTPWGAASADYAGAATPTFGTRLGEYPGPAAPQDEASSGETLVAAGGTADNSSQDADTLSRSEDAGGAAGQNTESAGSAMASCSGHKTARTSSIKYRLLGSRIDSKTHLTPSSAKKARKGPAMLVSNAGLTIDEQSDAKDFEGNLREQLQQQYQSHRARWLEEKRREIAAGHSTFSASCLASPDCSPVASPSSASDRPAERTNILDLVKSKIATDPVKTEPDKATKTADSTLGSAKALPNEQKNAADSFLALNKKIRILQGHLDVVEDFLIEKFSTADPNCGYVEREEAAVSDLTDTNIENTYATANNTTHANGDSDNSEETASYSKKAARVLGESLGFEGSSNKASRVMGESLGVAVSSRKAARVLGEGIGLGITASSAARLVVVDDTLDMEVVSFDDAADVDDFNKGKERKTKRKKGRGGRLASCFSGMCGRRSKIDE